MSNPLSALNFAAFNVGGANMLALLRTFSFSVENDLVDAAGLADRYHLDQAVKQGQTADFTVFMPGSGGLLASNLDVTLWSLGGTDFLGVVRSGVIAVTTLAKEESGIAAAYKFPNANRTLVEVRTEKLVVTSAPFVESLMTGTAASFEVAAAITFGGEAFACPVCIKSARHLVDRDEMQLEEVEMAGAGVPTGPSDDSLIGNMLLGSALVSLAVDTGGGAYATGDGQTALITKLVTSFKDGALIEQVGTLAVQGGAVWSA